MIIRQPPLTIVAPCYNENIVVLAFLQNLEAVLKNLPRNIHVIIVNDGSTDNTPELLNNFRFTARNLSFETIDLPVNIGHQGAIYEGLLRAVAGHSAHFIVMDADGEDAPATIPLLLEHTGADVVHVVRGRRSESVLFRSGYYCYKALFRLLTGKKMNFGNFCLFSRAVAEQTVAVRFTHLASFLAKQKYAARYIIAARDPRLGGRSKMSLGKLFRHAVSSFAEYGSSSGVPLSGPRV